MKRIHIISVHAFLSEAVEVSGLDLSHNQEAYDSFIKAVEPDCFVAYVTHDGHVYYGSIDPATGIKTVSQLGIFSTGANTEEPYSIVTFSGSTLTISEPCLLRNESGEHVINSKGLMVLA